MRTWAVAGFIGLALGFFGTSEKAFSFSYSESVSGDLPGLPFSPPLAGTLDLGDNTVSGTVSFIGGPDIDLFRYQLPSGTQLSSVKIVWAPNDPIAFSELELDDLAGGLVASFDLFSSIPEAFPFSSALPLGGDHVLAMFPDPVVGLQTTRGRSPSRRWDRPYPSPLR